MAESIALELFSRKSYKDSDGTTWVVRIPLPHVTIMDGACPSGERTHTDCTVEYRCLRSCSRNITASEIKLASVKLGMKYMKRVCSELEMIAGSPEEEELMLQGVRFAFRVHQVRYLPGAQGQSTVPPPPEQKSRPAEALLQVDVLPGAYFCKGSVNPFDLTTTGGSET
ncbi:hypothetical protein B296_00016556 [Ensete ventricosum]|uniref:Uncharacterized protein n=1 Tax=Ensete ventricosum TaxID=4639 RepID=A0A427AA40_ENSVE|nr:hypothetical protein B296_00016556 [Ensete ventricosum]